MNPTIRLLTTVVVLLVLGSLVGLYFAAFPITPSEPAATPSKPILEVAPSQPVRVALVSNYGESGPRPLIDLAHVQLGDRKAVALLDRSEIDRVLAEQKLSLAGLMDASRAVQVGRLLGVDLFAVLDADPEGNEAFGLVAYEARSGVRHWDAALPAGTLAQQADALAAALEAAARKYRAGPSRARTICLLGVRNVNLPRALDSRCDALGQILERQLVRLPQLAVLERKRLEALNRENELTGAAPLPALVTLELEIGRGPAGRFQLAAALADAKGKLLQKLSAESDDLTTLTDALLPSLLNWLGVETQPGKADPLRESQRFQREAEVMWRHQHFEAALRSAESAHALDPANQRVRCRLGSLLVRRAVGELDTKASSGGLLVPYRRFSEPVTAESVANSILIAARGHDLAWPALGDLRRRNPNALEVADEVLFHNALAGYLSLLARLEPGLRGEPILAEIGRLRQAAGRASADYFEQCTAIARQNGQAFRAYAVVAHRNTELAQWHASTPAEHLEVMFAGTEQFVQVAAKHPNVNSSHLQTYLLDLLSVPGFYWWRRTPDRADWLRLESQFQFLERQDHPVLRLYGQVGALWAGQRSGRLSDREALRQFHAFQQAAFALIEQPGAAYADETRHVGYTLLYKALKLVTFPDAETQWAELRKMCDFMLQRQEVSHWLVGMENLPGPVEGRLEVLDRAIAGLHSGQFHLVGGHERKYTEELLAKVRLKLGGPALPPVATAPPWKSVQALVTLPELPPLTALTKPLVHEDQVWVVGARTGPVRAGELELIRVPLAGGKATRLGKAQIPKLAKPNYTRRVKAACLGPGQVYVSFMTEGIFAFDMRAPRVRRLPHELPAEAQSLAFLDGKLYAGLSDGYLVRLDADGSGFEVLASSRRKQKESPFDDGKPFVATYLTADPARQRLLVGVTHGNRRSPLDGLWEFRPADGQFQQHASVGGITWGSPIRNDHVLVCSHGYSLRFDLKANQTECLWINRAWHHDFELPARCTGYYHAYPPHYFLDHWLWSANRFARIDLDRAEQERLPAPAPLPNDYEFGANECLEPLGDNRLLVANGYGLWLVTLADAKGGRP